MEADIHQVQWIPWILLNTMTNAITYPTDPKTVAWIKSSLEPTFGFPSLVRFSWTTVKVALEKHGHSVKWYAILVHDTSILLFSNLNI